MKTMTFAEMKQKLTNQGVSSRLHYAFVCPRCGTVQSPALLEREGCPKDKLDSYVGFSCVGRFNNAGPLPKDNNRPGCNWTLGGLFQFHKLELVDEDGKTHPFFEPATSKAAKALEQQMSGVA